MSSEFPSESEWLARPWGWSRAPMLAIVSSLDDPDRRNRVQVRLIGADESERQDAPLWARVVCPFAGSDRGAFLMPDVEDEVLVVFQGGDPRFPLVVGGLWNGASASPADLEGGTNRLKVIRSRRGVSLTLDDSEGQERFSVETPGGQRLTLSDGPGTITIEDSNGNSATFEASGVTLEAAAKVTVKAAQVEVSAGMVTVDAGLAKFSGVVKCDTLISNAVVSSSYTPGAGNVW
jgi:uncharacterized protein involved in type VI secretion and phage assembly